MGSPARSTTLLRSWRLKPLAAAIVTAGAFGSGDDHAATLVVGTLSEQSVSACTLRDAVASVNFQHDTGRCAASGAYGSDDAIGFAPGLSGTITFFHADPLSNPASPSALAVQRSVTIQGPGSGHLSLACGNAIIRLLEVDATARATSLSGVSLVGCAARGPGGGVRADFSLSNVAHSVQFTDVTLARNKASQGGGLALFGGTGGDSVTLSACNVASNVATTLGGGIYLSGNATGARTDMSIADSIVVGNTARLGAGALLAGATADIAFTRATLDGNMASSDGGGIEVENAAIASVRDSTLSRNRAAASGGGVRALNGASFSATNSTLSGNSAGQSGGGVYALGLGNGAIALANSTLASNAAGSGGGIAIENTFPVGQMTPANAVNIVDTLVAGNAAPSDTLSTELPGNVLPWNVSYSVIGMPGNVSPVGTGNITDGAVPPPFGPGGWLGPLQNNRGPTQTHALLVRVPDPAVDAGDPAFTGLKFDQRGAPFKRVENGRVDIGAYEVQTSLPAAVPGPRGLMLSLLAALLGLLTWRRQR